MNLKTYKNRYASIEQQSDGTWLVFNELSGLPVYENLDADEPEIKFFPTYAAARTAMIELTQRATAIARGGNMARFA